MGDAHLPEQAPARALGPQDTESRIRAVHGDAEAHSQFTIVPGSHERHHVGPVGVGDQVSDPLEEPGTVEELTSQGPGGRLHRGDQMQAPAGVAGDDPRHQVQVVVDDVGGYRLPGDVDHAGVRLSQEQEQEQVSLLVGLYLAG